MLAHTADTDSETREYSDAAADLCHCGERAKRCGDCDEIHAASQRRSRGDLPHDDPLHTVDIALGSSLGQNHNSETCFQPQRDETDSRLSNASTLIDAHVVKKDVSGHVFQKTYVTGNAVAVQGDIYHTSSPKTVIRVVREKRSPFDVFVASLIGGTAGGFLVTAATRKTYNESNRECKEQANHGPDALTGWQPVSDDDWARRSSPRQSKTFHSVGSKPFCVSGQYPMENVRQLNMAYRMPISTHVDRMAHKVIEKPAPRSKVLVIQVDKTREARNSFLLSQLKKHNDLTVVNRPAEAISRLRQLPRCFEAIVIYDTSSLTCAAHCPLLKRDMLAALADFTSTGGTTIFGPKCDIFNGSSSVADLLAEVWHLQIELRAPSRYVQFTVSPSLASLVGRALPYYYRDVARQLARFDKVKTTHIAVSLSEDVDPVRVTGPRCRSRSEHTVMLIQYGKGRLGILGNFGSYRDTSRMVCSMIDARDATTSSKLTPNLVA